MSNSLKPFQPISFSSAEFKYLDKTSESDPKVSKDGKDCVVLTAKGTDWWRNLERDSRDGLVWGFWHDFSGEGKGLEIRVKCEVQEETQYDQAAVFLYLDKHAWVKAGVEFDRGEVWDAVVATNPYSDWSIQPHTAPSGTRPTFTIAYDRQKSHLRVFRDDILIREVNAFGVASSASPSTAEKPGRVFVGVMGCSPLGGGVEARFEGFELREGVRE